MITGPTTSFSANSFVAHLCINYADRKKTANKTITKRLNNLKIHFATIHSNILKGKKKICNSMTIKISDFNHRTHLTLFLPSDLHFVGTLYGWLVFHRQTSSTPNTQCFGIGKIHHRNKATKRINVIDVPLSFVLFSVVVVDICVSFLSDYYCCIITLILWSNKWELFYVVLK